MGGWLGGCVGRMRPEQSLLWHSLHKLGQTHALYVQSLTSPADACLQVMFAMAQALHASAASADAVSAAHAAEARDLAEQRLGLQSLITGLAAIQTQQRKQHPRQQAGDDARQQRDQEQGDAEMQDAGLLFDVWGAD